MMRRFLVIYQTGPNHLSAYVPDVPGCASIGHSLEELRENIHDELEFHLEHMALQGRAVPDPIVGVSDVAPGVHAEWMLVRRLPAKKAMALKAKFKQRLRRAFGLLGGWFLQKWNVLAGLYVSRSVSR